MVLAVGHEQPHVGEQGGGLEQLAGVVAQPVDACRLVEQHQREAGHVGRVLGLFVHQLGQAHHAASAQVVQMVQSGAVRALERVEQRAFAQRVARHHHLVDAQGAHRLLER